MYSKESSFCDTLFAFSLRQNLSKIVLPLTQLHSERSKLYTFLAFLSAIGLKERVFLHGKTFFLSVNPSEQRVKIKTAEFLPLKYTLSSHSP